MLRKFLLFCGVLSSLLYLFMIIYVPLQWPGYSSTSQTISELSAIDAPTRALWVLLGFAYTLLVIAIGGLDGPGVAANTPTPLIGIWERISLGVYIIWVMVLALEDWARNPQVKMLGITVANS